MSARNIQGCGPLNVRKVSPVTAHPFSISPETGKDKGHVKDYFTSLNFVNVRDTLRVCDHTVERSEAAGDHGVSL